MKPSVHFIEGDPPPTRRTPTHTEASGYVLGVLGTRPNTWAEVAFDTETPAALLANRLVKKGEKLGLECEATSRGDTVYARVKNGTTT